MEADIDTLILNEDGSINTEEMKNQNHNHKIYTKIKLNRIKH